MTGNMKVSIPNNSRSQLKSLYLGNYIFIQDKLKAMAIYQREYLFMKRHVFSLEQAKDEEPEENVMELIKPKKDNRRSKNKKRKIIFYLTIYKEIQTLDNKSYENVIVFVIKINFE